jgi:hypothetical protein
MTIAGKEIKMGTSSSITIPTPLLTVIISILSAAIISWGIVAELRLQSRTNKDNIETLRKEKVDKEQFTLVYDKLKIIEKKIDDHMSKEK